jgi:DNA-binding NarL/FixJ family response regulator
VAPRLVLSLLLVDDSAPFLLHTRHFLETTAAEDITVVATAANAEAALKAAQQLKPDAVLVDPVMPGTTGVELIVQLRSLLPRSAIVALSLVSDPAFEERAIAGERTRSWRRTA